MEISVGGVLISAVLLTAMLMLVRAANVSNTIVGMAVRDAANVSGERARMAISIQSASTAGGATTTIQVQNTGSVAISDFAHVDFYVDYVTSGGSAASTRLTRTLGTPGANQWRLVSISPDVFQPGIVDPGETATLEGVLSPTMLNPSTGAVAIATPKGVAATFPLSNP